MGCYNCGLLMTPYGTWGHLSLRVSKEPPEEFLAIPHGERPARHGHGGGNTGTMYEPIFNQDHVDANRRLPWVKLLELRDGRILWGNQKGDTDNLERAVQPPEIKYDTNVYDVKNWLYPVMDHEGVRYTKLYECLSGWVPKEPPNPIRFAGERLADPARPFHHFKEFPEISAGRVMVMSTAAKYGAPQRFKPEVLKEMGFLPLVIWHNEVYGGWRDMQATSGPTWHFNVAWVKDCTEEVRSEA